MHQPDTRLRHQKQHFTCIIPSAIHDSKNSCRNKLYRTTSTGTCGNSIRCSPFNIRYRWNRQIGLLDNQWKHGTYSSEFAGSELKHIPIAIVVPTSTPLQVNSNRFRIDSTSSSSRIQTFRLDFVPFTIHIFMVSSQSRSKQNWS